MVPSTVLGAAWMGGEHISAAQGTVPGTFLEITGRELGIFLWSKARFFG